MNFNPNIQIVKGGEIPNNSVALIYSPHCGHCHHMIPEYNNLPNALRAGGLSDTQVVAVDIQQEFHSLRAGGLQVMGVPHVIIKTVQGGYIQYTGPRMADSIAQEAARVLNGGETKDLNGGSTPDALLGGSTPVVASDAAATLEGGRKRRRSRKSKSRSRKTKSRSRKHRKHHRKHHMKGGDAETIEGGETAATETTETAVTGGATEASLEGGRKRRRSRKSKSRSRKTKSRSRKHRKHHMKGGDATIEGGETVAETETTVTGGATEASLEGGRKRRRSRKSKSRSRSRHHRKHHMKGGEVVEGLEIEGGEDIEGGKSKRKNPKSRSRTLWMRTIAKLYKTGKYKNWASAMKSAKKIYRKAVNC